MVQLWSVIKSTDTLRCTKLGFVFQTTKDMAYGIDHLVAAGNTAVHAMRRRCIYLHLSDAATIC